MSKESYIAKNREWLVAKAQEPGVMPLAAGVYYKVLQRGNVFGPTPNKGSVVSVLYIGKTITGKTFDSSRGGVPGAFRLRDLIPGWIIVLSKMRPGDRWEVYIPAGQGYGKRGVPGIPGGSTLVFDISLQAVY